MTSIFLHRFGKMMIFRRSRNGILPTWLLLVLCLFVSHQSTYGLDEEIIQDLSTPNRNFGLKTINYFVELVNTKKPNFKMIKVTDKNTIQHYVECKTDDDLQILYSNEMGKDSGINYLTILSKKTYGRNVYVYDGLLRRELSEHQKQIIDQRYPGNRIAFHQPWTWQLSGPSSGPLAIAYATILANGGDPPSYPLQLNMSNPDPTIELRRHILGMFQRNELTPFPRARKEDALFIPQIMAELGSKNQPFSDATINYFIQMVRLLTNFDMINLVNYNKAYQPANPAEQDIQILYGDGTLRNYYICVFYEPKSKKVYVYDTLQQKKLNSRNSEIIKQRYPRHKKIVFAEPSKMQNERKKELEKMLSEGKTLREKLKLRFKDRTGDKEIIKISSGPMSIAYAASLIRASLKHVSQWSFYIESIDDLQLDKISLDEPIGDNFYTDLRKNILHIFKQNSLSSMISEINGEFISPKPPSAPRRTAGSSSSREGDIDGAATLLLTMTAGFPIFSTKNTKNT